MHACTHRVVLTLNNERDVRSDQCLCFSMAWWSVGWMREQLLAADILWTCREESRENLVGAVSEEKVGAWITKRCSLMAALVWRPKCLGKIVRKNQWWNVTKTRCLYLKNFTYQQQALYDSKIGSPLWIMFFFDQFFIGRLFQLFSLPKTQNMTNFMQFVIFRVSSSAFLYNHSEFKKTFTLSLELLLTARRLCHLRLNE